jgi:glucans biosynthesis protein
MSVTGSLRQEPLYGGAAGSGAPRGNQNALKQGLFTREAIDERRQAQALIRQSRKLLHDLE